MVAQSFDEEMSQIPSQDCADRKFVPNNIIVFGNWLPSVTIVEKSIKMIGPRVVHKN